MTGKGDSSAPARGGDEDAIPIPLPGKDSSESVGCSLAILKILRYITHPLFGKVEFHPRYVWKGGVMGTSRVYKGLEDEHEEKWTGLFIDLIYVCVCSKIAHMLAYCELDFDLIVTSFTFMFIFFLSRFFFDEYNIRFEQDDLVQRIANLVFFYGICCMLINTNLDEEENYADRRLGEERSDRKSCSLSTTYFSGFVVGYLRTRLAFMIKYVFLMIIDREDKVYHMFVLRVWCWVIAMLLMCLAAYGLSGMSSIWTGFAVLVLETLSFTDSGAHVWLRKRGLIATKTGALFFPTNFLTAQQRVSIYILVVIGEALILVLTPTWSPMQFNDEGYYVILFTLVLFFGLAYYYFDHVLKGRDEMHVCKRSAILGKFFFVLQGITGYCLVLISAAFYGIYDYYDGEYWDDASFRMLCIGCFVTTVMMNICALFHKGFTWHFSQGPKEILRLCAHFGLAFVHLGVMWSRKSLSPFEAVVIHSLLFSLQVLGEIALGFSEGSVEINPRRERARTVNLLMHYKNASNLSRDDHQRALIAAVAASEEELKGSHTGTGSRARSTVELMRSICENERDCEDDDSVDGLDKLRRRSQIPAEDDASDGEGEAVSAEDMMLAAKVGERMNVGRERSGTRTSINDSLDTMDRLQRETRTTSIFANEGESEAEIDMSEVLILNEMNGIKRSFVDHYREAVEAVCERRERARTLRPELGSSIDDGKERMRSIS